MTDEDDRLPNWDEERTSIGKSRDFLAPPREQPPNENIPIEPPEQDEEE